MSTSEIRTDAGPAYVKALGNREGPHCLACEWVGTRLADLLGLQTFDYGLMQLADDDVPFDGLGTELPGTCFVTRSEVGAQWSGLPKDLDRVGNKQDIARLVVIDTWLRNGDRHSPNGDIVKPDNVYLSYGRPSHEAPCLIAMDFSHSISNGGLLSEDLARIHAVKDEAVWGAFSAFRPYLTDPRVREAVQALSSVSEEAIIEVVESIPADWEVNESSRAGLRRYLWERRLFLLDPDRMRGAISILVRRDSTLNLEETGDMEQ